MFQKHILFVDDLPDIRKTVEQLLRTPEFTVRTVASRAEALQAIETERFHIAILDVRLDDSEPDNRDGLVLMHELKQADASLAILLLSGYVDVKMVQEALLPDKQGQALAFSFVEKDRLDELPDYVRRACEQLVRIEAELEIRGRDWLNKTASKYLRFSKQAKPLPSHMEDETIELVHKLFYGCAQVELRPLTQGFSGAITFLAIPYFRERGHGEAVVVKIGETNLIQKEVQNYRMFVEGSVGGHRLPFLREPVRTRYLAGIIYTFVGLGHSQDFVSFFNSAQPHVIDFALHSLFERTCFPWRQDIGTVTHCDLRQAHIEILSLSIDKAEAALNHLLGGRHPFASDDDTHWIWLDGVKRLNPVAYAARTDFTFDCFRSLIHGDLQGNNVLVDHYNETWLIDFARTARGPILQDYASFEMFLRLMAMEQNDWLTIQTWENAMFQGTDFFTLDVSRVEVQDETLNKTRQAITTVRQLARRTQATQMERGYLAALLFNALKIVTIMDRPAKYRDHALLAATLAAEQLEMIA